MEIDRPCRGSYQPIAAQNRTRNFRFQYRTRQSHSDGIAPLVARLSKIETLLLGWFNIRTSNGKITIAKKMTSGKLLAIYCGFSTAIAVFARPGHDAVSSLAILTGGTAGCLRLIVEGVPFVYYEDLALGWQFNGEALAICLFALVLWLLGGLLLFLGARKQWHAGYVAGLIAVWIVGSVYNMAWFTMMSL